MPGGPVPVAAPGSELIDVVGDTANDPPLSASPWGDYFSIAVDVNNNKAIDANVDVSYGRTASGQLCLQRFLGSGVTTPCSAPGSELGTGFGPTRASATPHRFWELAIRLSEMGVAPGQTVGIGVRAYSQNPSFTDDLPPGFQWGFGSLLALTLTPAGGGS